MLKHSRVFLSALTLVALAAPPSLAQEGRIVEASGTVLLKRSSWSQFLKTNIGTELRSGDLVKPASGSRVVVLCASTRRWVVPSGVPSGVNNGCPDRQAILLGLRGDGSEIVPSQESVPGGVDSQIPYVISPRRSWILNSRPLLRWNAIAPTISYTVQVVGPGINWQTTTTRPEVQYSGKALQPGETYLVTVRATGGKSSQDEPKLTNEAVLFYEDRAASGWGFSLMPEEFAQPIRAAVQKVKAQGLTPEAEALAIAAFYSRQELKAEAIDLLEAQVRQNSQTTAIYGLLGDLYSYVGLNRLAETRYTQAIALATATDDIEGLAAAHAGLAKVYTVIGDRAAATRELDQARQQYQAIGDHDQASQLESALLRLSGQQHRQAQ